MKGSDILTISINEDAGVATVKLTAYGKRAMKYDGLWFADIMKDISFMTEEFRAIGYANFEKALSKRLKEVA